LALLLLLPVCLVLALTFGAVSLSLRDVLHVLFSSDLDSRFDSADIIINQIRLPRILLTAIVGGLLAISGAAMQGLFRNPLADPSLIGVTAGASVGASRVIVFGGAWLGTIWGLSLLSVGAFIGGVVTVLLVYRLATGVGGTSVATMLLAGIAITALAGGIGGLLQFMADNEMLRRISLWSMGGLGAANYLHLITAAIVALFVFVLLPRDSMALNAMLLGESEARHLGINVEAVKTRLIILVAAGVGTSVALAGSIAFVGLVVPHIVRMLIGPDHRYLLPASTLAGAILLVLADIVARTLISPTELPVGLVTAFIGAPFFISLLRRRHIYGMQ
jgi:iron complex transport system permease protein